MSNTVALSLLVIRVTDIERSMLFYPALGLTFVREQHNQGAIHYSTSIGPTILEIYPASQKFPVTTSRLGFTVISIANVLEQLKILKYDVKIRQQKSPSDFSSIIEDPDGHIIELMQTH